MSKLITYLVIQKKQVREKTVHSVSTVNITLFTVLTFTVCIKKSFTKLMKASKILIKSKH